MTPVWGFDQEVIAWVGARIEGGERGFTNARAMGVVDAKGHLVAGVVFHDWSPERQTIELTVAAKTPRWLTRGVVKEVFDYAFSFARLAVAQSSATNYSAAKIWRALGASVYVIDELYDDGVDLLFFTLSPEQLANSKFGEKHG